MAIGRWTLVVASLALACGSSSADEVCRPVTPERIEQQWANYRGQPGVEVLAGSDGYECISFPNSKARESKVVCRTRPVHPAHPAIVVQVIFEENGAVYIRLEGDTAGDCAEFLKMMDAFEKKNEDLRRKFPSGR